MSSSLTLITALWRRPELTRTFLEYWDQFDLNLVAAISPEDDTDPQPIGKWQFVEAANIPLSGKFQAALDAAPESSAYMIIGSDDFADQAYLDKVAEIIADYQMVQPVDIFMADDEECYYCNGWTTGAGRVISHNLLEAAGGKLWESPVNRGLDNKMMEHLGKHAESVYLYQHADHETVLVDYKTVENMWSLKQTLPLLPLYRKVPRTMVLPPCLLRKSPPDL